MSPNIQIKDFKKGDYANFEYAFNTYSKELYVFAYRLVQDKAIAEDVVQDFFVKLWLNKDDIYQGPSFRSYCYTSIHHISLNVLRTKYRHTELFENIIDSTDVQFEMERADLRSKLEQAIATLPKKCKEIFVEVCVEGKSYAEVADKYDLSVNTIKVQVSKAYRILREKLSSGEKLVLFLWCMQQYRNQNYWNV